MSSYKALRTWSFALKIFGVFGIITASFGVVSWAVSVDGFWETTGVILFGAPIVILFATWPIALGQALKVIADIGDAVTFDGPTDAPRLPGGLVT